MSQDKQHSAATVTAAPPPATTSGGTKQQQKPQTSQSVEATPSSKKPAMEKSQQQTKLVANLHSAANEGKVELVRLLLRCGADVNAQDEQFGNTALHQAAWNGFSQTVQVLCKYRANTSIRNKAQFTPLHMACQQGHNQTVRLLLMANAKTEAKNSYGDTPLHTAARYGHAGAARILLSAKCNPNQVNKNHDTPLHIAAAMGRRKLTKIFMQNGAEPAIKNKQNETAMDIALRKDLIDIQEIIANPPPARASSRKWRAEAVAAAAAEDHAHHLGQLEQRYGALYALAQTDGGGHTRVAAAQQSGRQHKHRGHAHPLNLKYPAHLSSEDNCSSGRQRSRRNVGVELAVDVPGEPLPVRRKAAAASGGGPEAAVFASAHSLAVAAPLPQRRHINRMRTKTLSGAMAELRLLTAVSAVDLNRTPSTNYLGSEACLPDARDNSNKWAEMMAKSARFQQPQQQHSPTVIEMEEEEEAAASTIAAGRRAKSASPGAGSLRSSLSKSRGRLVLRRNRKPAGGLLARRSNLGTCVGKLSLMRLRTMVTSKRRQDPAAEDYDDNEEAPDEVDEHGDTKQADDDSCSSKAAGAQPSKATPPVTSGRRQERLERLRGEAAPVAQMRAPNGAKLQATRPLAPLNDDTQLYAIPRKPKAAKQQVAGSISATACEKRRTIITANTANSESSKAKQQQQQDNGSSTQQQQQHYGHELAASIALRAAASAPAAASSDGPALTSDGCQTSTSGSDGSSSSFARASPPASSSSDAIASSSDECIESMDLVCGKSKDKAAGGASAASEAASQAKASSRPDDALDDLFAPGYSVVRQQPDDNNTAGEVQYHGSDQETGKQMFDGDSVTQQAPVAKTKQQVAKPNGSRLRQLLHLEPRTAKSATQTAKGARQPEQLTWSTHNGGESLVAANSSSNASYYSQLVATGQQQQQLGGAKKTNGASEQVAAAAELGAKQPKKSWLMSRFSLPSNNNLASGQQSAKQQDQNANQELNGREDDHTQQQQVGDQSDDAIQNDRKTEPLTNGNQHETDDEGLIRPKSALAMGGGSRHSELIAAQKSLAAAAAAKVKRDRLFKEAGSDTGGASQQHPGTTTSVVANHHHVLTVKTSGDPFWTSALHHQRGQVSGTAAAGQKGGGYVIGQPLVRSGTNSVGMSDSSPSNNGAESDNSIQTTTGSLTTTNTDNTSGGQPAQVATSTSGGGEQQQQNSSPLGILSRILLNSKSAGAVRQAAPEKNAGSAKSAGSDSTSTLRQADVGSLSSSALSSPDAINERSPDAAVASAAADQTGNQKLGQLGSRSRCPIVIARSNELANNDDHAAAPRLPAKSVLKPASVKFDAQHAMPPPPAAMEPMNGLPRVASHTQISSSSMANGHMPLVDIHSGHMISRPSQQQPASLCNYHAMNRNHLIQAQYSPYLPYALGRYSLHGHCEPPVGSGEKYQQTPHHMSHHDLRTPQSATTIDTGGGGGHHLPASAINYEYYLEAPPPLPSTGFPSNSGLYQSHHNHLKLDPARYQSYTTAAVNDNSIYPTGYGHDDSIYIPSYLTNHHHQRQQIRDTNSMALGARPATAMASAIAGAAAPTSELLTNGKRGGGGNQLYSSHQQVAFDRFSSGHLGPHNNLVADHAAIQQQQSRSSMAQQRPKSSLDTFHLPGAGAGNDGANAVPPPPLPPPLTANNSLVGGLRRASFLDSSAAAGSLHYRNPLIFSLANNHQQAAAAAAANEIVQEQPNQSDGYLPYPSHQPYNTDRTSYIYSENCIYASDKSGGYLQSRHSDLTVLPTDAATAITTDNNSISTTSSPSYRQSPSVKVLAEGGGISNGMTGSHPAANECSNQTSAASPAHISSSPSPSLTPKAVVRQDKSSWTPSTPYRSLVQVNQPAKSNQSSREKEANPAVRTQTIRTENLFDIKQNKSDPEMSNISQRMTTISLKGHHTQQPAEEQPMPCNNKSAPARDKLSTVAESSAQVEINCEREHDASTVL